jgi:hypothetical protein
LFGKASVAHMQGINLPSATFMNSYTYSSWMDERG